MAIPDPLLSSVPDQLTTKLEESSVGGSESTALLGAMASIILYHSLVYNL